MFLNSIAAGGVLIADDWVQHSILFPSVYLDDQSIVENSRLFENIRVGRKARIKNCLIYKNVQIPDTETIGYDKRKIGNDFQFLNKA